MDWCQEMTCRNSVRNLSTADITNINIANNKTITHQESILKRIEECERLSLGRNIKNLPKDLRCCDNHPMENARGK